MNRDITEEEILQILRTLQNNKALGPAGLEFEFFKHSAPYLKLLFNKILYLKYFPSSWCNAMLIPIHKKGDPNNVNNYRGISLLNVLSKVFTKIINNKLVYWVEKESNTAS